MEIRYLFQKSDETVINCRRFMSSKNISPLLPTSGGGARKELERACSISLHNVVSFIKCRLTPKSDVRAWRVTKRSGGNLLICSVLGLEVEEM